VTIDKEIQHVKLYLDIQKIRYKDKFEVHWDIDKAILDYKIVKLSIQPLIENSIYHGIKPKKEKGTIFISGYAYEGYIIIQIKDDGIGLLQEEVELLNTEMRKDYIKEDTHIGIMNVNQRIKLLFGEEYGLIVQSEYKKFTAVKIIIPMVE
jgi:two-component system sensor histidine kinase YesM